MHSAKTSGPCDQAFVGALDLDVAGVGPAHPLAALLAQTPRQFLREHLISPIAPLAARPSAACALAPARRKNAA
jgi:hypothetical protein